MRERYEIRLHARWDDVPADWREIAARRGPTPFQQASWLSNWYATIGQRAGIRPLIVDVRESRTGTPSLLIPLIVKSAGRGGATSIEFADEELTDYNGVLLGEAAPDDEDAAADCWRTLRRALPPADVISLRKMPASLGAKTNPLWLMGKARLAGVNGNLIAIPGSWRDYHHGLDRPVRMELERSWRVFGRADPTARFVHVIDPSAVERYLAAMSSQQSQRFKNTGAAFRLGAADATAFYHAVATSGVQSGEAYLTALETDSEIVATMLSFRCGVDGVVATRVSNAAGTWAKCSPGRLIIHRTMLELHACGIRRFDFSIGNYDYKRRFGVTPFPLYDIVKPLTPRGLPTALRAWTAGALRRHPALDRRIRGWTGLQVRD